MKNILLLFLALFFGCGGADLSHSNEAILTSESPVTPPASLSTITLRTPQPSLLTGTTLQLFADLYFSNDVSIPSVKNRFLPPLAQQLEQAETLTWTSEQPAIAMVDGNGLVHTLSSGDVTITVSSGTKRNSVQLTVFRPLRPPCTQNHIVPPPNAQAPYIDRVVSINLGTSGGFGRSENVLGPPHGAGLFRGSTDVFSLGRGGEIILEFTDYMIADGEGPDFTVFENAFSVIGNESETYEEPATVAVSEDGMHFIEFPCQTTPPYRGCAGLKPIHANRETNEISPLDPNVSGGDLFDLADLCISRVRFIRIRDANIDHPPYGADNAGFDLDAIAVINGVIP